MASCAICLSGLIPQISVELPHAIHMNSTMNRVKIVLNHGTPLNTMNIYECD